MSSNDDCGVQIVQEPPVALVDYEMPVGQTGIFFVAALEARMMSWGPVFNTVATQAAYRRAASTLAHMALVSGATFEFLRVGAGMTQAEVASLLGTTSFTVAAWENGTQTTPTHQWYLLADKVCALDKREFCPYLTLPEQDFRPRRIRVHPDIPRLNASPPPAPPC